MCNEKDAAVARDRAHTAWKGGRTMAGRLKWLAAAGMLAAFFLLAFHLDSLAWLDAPVYAAVSRLHGGSMTRFWHVATQAVHPAVLAALSVGLIWLLHDRRYTAPILMNLGLSVLLNLGLKSLFARPRPADVVRLVEATGYSFPSGHAMAAMTFYGFAIYLVSRSALPRRARRPLCALLGALIAMVCVSRVYLGAHYASDVLGGLLASGAYLIVFTSFVTTYFQDEHSLARAGVGKSGSLFSSFAHAFDGVITGLRAERNMIIHFGAMVAVIVFGVILHISTVEWVVCLTLCALVMALELVNTAVETAVDLCTEAYDPRAKVAKDTAAGAVLVAAVGAAIVGCVIFLPKLLEIVRAEFL